MNWRFIYFFDIETNLSASEIADRLQSISRPGRSFMQTVNPDEMFKGEYKEYIGNVDTSGFRLKKSYYSMRGTTMGLLLTGMIEERSTQTIVHVKCKPPTVNLLWFLFPPFWMMLGGCVALDHYFLQNVPVITLLCLLLLAYFYRIVLAQFIRHANDNKEYLERLLKRQINSGGFINIFFS